MGLDSLCFGVLKCRVDSGEVPGMIFRAFYEAPFILPNSVIAETDSGLFLLREGGMVHLAEAPPVMLKLSLYKERRFFNKKKEQPHQDHLTPLSSIYTSRLDTLFFFESGAVIKLVHRFPLANHSPVFYTAQEAKLRGILSSRISEHLFYTEITPCAEPYAKPVEATYIVYPGYLMDNESYLFPTKRLQGDTLSVDFVMNDFAPPQHPIQLRQFWQIPSLFCASTHAAFDQAAWDAYAEDKYLPCDYKSHAFYLQDKCIAEIITVDTYSDPGFFPYHDSFTLTLHCLKEYKADVEKVIRHLLTQYDNILPMPPHLCGDSTDQ